MKIKAMPEEYKAFMTERLSVPMERELFEYLYSCSQDVTDEEVRRDVLRPYSVTDDSFIRVRVATIGSETWCFRCQHHAFWDNLAEWPWSKM